MATVSVSLNQYKQPVIQNVTLTNEIKLDQICIGDKPKALFIIAPDEKEETYKFATLLVNQLYKSNISVAANQPNQVLERKLMFFLDEFGNIPTIPKFDTMITVSRSCCIYFSIAVQGLDQIKSKYGEDKLKTIRDNMLLHLYVQTPDESTNNYYSTRAGEFTVNKTSTSNSNNNTGTSNSSSINIDKMKLLTIDQIANNPLDMIIVFKTNTPVAWIKTNYYYQCKNYSKYIVDSFNNLKEKRIFRYDDYSYNIKFLIPNQNSNTNNDLLNININTASFDFDLILKEWNINLNNLKQIQKNEITQILLNIYRYYNNYLNNKDNKFAHKNLLMYLKKLFAYESIDIDWSQTKIKDIFDELTNKTII